jgi:hypothetical protein
VRVIGLIVLSAALVGGLGGAYLLYDSGVPGSPRLPAWDGVPSNRSADSIGLMVPPGLSVRQEVLLGSTQPHPLDRAETSGSVDPTLRLDPGALQVNVKVRGHGTAPFDLVLALESGARVQPADGLRLFASPLDGYGVTVDGPHDRWKPTDGGPPQLAVDHYVLHVTPDQAWAGRGPTELPPVQFDLFLRPLWPFAVRDNARVVVRSPLLHGAVGCRDLDGFMHSVKQGSRNPPAPDCSRADVEFETAVVLDIERAEWKSDLLDPEPFDGRQRGHVDGATRWVSTQPIRVTGNYVNINAEAAGQRSLFLAGLVAGFALGLVPVIVEKVRYPTGRTAVRGTGSRSRRWSRARRR